MTAIVKSHPVISFFLLSVLLGMLPLALVSSGLLPVAFSQLGAFSASIAGFILASIGAGRESVTDLLRRVLIWRVGFRWWITAILYTAIMAAAALFLSSKFDGITIDWQSLPPIYQVIPMMFILIVLAGLGEEFGWRGFLIPVLQCRHSALVSSLIIGVCHSFWHLPLFLVEGTAQSEWAQQLGLIPAFLGYSVFVIAWAIQLSWFFNNTKGSVLLVAVVHGAGNAWIGGYFDVSGNAGTLGNNMLTVLMATLSLALVVIAGKNLMSNATLKKQ